MTIIATFEQARLPMPSAGGPLDRTESIGCAR
jgi:hypothetical protein